MKQSNLNFPANSIRICVDCQENQEMRGSICGVAIDDTMFFHNVANLVLQIENALDKIGTPQPYQKIRSFQDDVKAAERGCFGNPKRYWEASAIRDRLGLVKTLDVLVASRQHSSWQGFVKDIQGNLIGEFHSDLELLKLIVDAKVN